MSITLCTPAGGATLQALLSGGSMTVGNSRFSNWQLLHVDATSGASPDLSLVNVNPLTGDPLNPGLQFATASQFSIAGINAIDLLVQYRVDALPGSNSFTGHALSLTGIAFGTDGGIAYISDEITSHLGADFGPTLVVIDNVSDVTQTNSTSSFSPQAGLVVAANVFITGLADSDSINLTSFTQRFAQNGASVLAGDYNQDGAVDAADYVTWRKSGGPLAGLSVWQTNFGDTLGGTATSASGPPVASAPEPSASTLIMLSALVLPRRRRAKSRSTDGMLQSRCSRPASISPAALSADKTQ